MPRGGKPKVYPPAMVARVRELYSSGMTRGEVASELGVAQKVIWRLMLRHGIPARVAAKRDQRGGRNHMWKGQKAGYQAAHLRVAAARDVRLCCSCHHKMDGHVRNLGAYAERKEVPNA